MATDLPERSISRGLSGWYLCFVLLALSLGSCGADDDAPAPPQPSSSTGCPPLRTIVPVTMRLLEEGELPGIRRLTSERLTDEQMAALLNGILRFVGLMTPSELSALAELSDHPSLSAVSNSALELLEFVAGDPARPETFKVDLIAEFRWLISTCEAHDMLTAINETIKAPELPQIFDAIRELLKLPEVLEALSGPTPQLDPDGFATLICNLMASISRPNFTVQNDIIQPLERLNLFPLDRPPASSLVQALSTMLSRERPLLPAVADLVCCDTYGLPECSLVDATIEPLNREPHIALALHEMFSSQTLDLPSILSALSDLGSDERVRTALTPISRAFGEVIGDDLLRETIASLLKTILEEETARLLFADIQTIIDSGAGQEFFDLIEVMANGCDAATMLDQ